jgi:hypothetical protein
MDGDTRDLQPRRIAPYVVAAFVLGVGILGLVMAIAAKRTNSAVLFVGLPTALALALTLARPARSVHGLTFRVISIGLLLASVLLHEGAICLIVAAPLVYAVGHCLAAVIQSDRRRASAFVLVPVALVLSLEGVQPDWRISPVQTVTATRTVAVGPAEVARRVAAGPRVDTTPRPGLVALLPLPAHAGGSGDHWFFHFDGDSHGPGGELVTEVTDRGPSGLGFRPVSDTSVVARWLDWRGARLAWHGTASGDTEVTLTMTFTRGLDPSWYFGPIEQLLVRAAAGYLLDSMALS